MLENPLSAQVAKSDYWPDSLSDHLVREGASAYVMLSSWEPTDKHGVPAQDPLS